MSRLTAFENKSILSWSLFLLIKHAHVINPLILEEIDCREVIFIPIKTTGYLELLLLLRF